MAPPKGTTNNPSGRPRKNTALAEILDRALSKTIEVKDGKLSGKRIMASLVVEGITTGRVTFPGENQASVISVKDWIELVKWGYQYLDPPVNKIAPTTPDGENPYMNAEASELLELARKIANAKHTDQ